MGSVLATCTNDTRAAELGSSTSSHCAPTVCVHVPIQLPSTPSHSQRKTRCPNGAQAEDSAGCTAVALSGSVGSPPAAVSLRVM
jgi:hypothetical protein